MLTYPRKCCTCGKKEIVPDIHTTTVELKCHGIMFEFEVEGVPVYKCRNCSEILYGNHSEDYIREAFLEDLKAKHSIQTVKLFVYGTLKQWEVNHSQISHAVYWARPGTVKGTLLDFGGFPGLIDGDDIIEGQVLDLEESALTITDRIEGYNPDTETGLYLRCPIMVLLGKDETFKDITVEAMTYKYAHGDKDKDLYPHVTNWRDHRHKPPIHM